MMFRVLLTALGFSICSAYAQSPVMYLQESSGIAVNIAPNEVKMIGNAFTCTMHIECEATCQDNATNIIHFSVLNRGGSLNGVPVTKGDAMDVVINTGDKLSIVAQPASRVELKNIGTTNITSMCNVTCR